MTEVDGPVVKTGGPVTETGEPVVEELVLGRFDRHGITRARLGQRLIEVEHGIPDEVVHVTIDGGKRPYGHIVDIPRPSPHRIEPPCPYFRDWSCGGCQWQQIEYASQLRFKRIEVEEVMAEAGFDLAIERVHAQEDPWRYRSTAGISLGRRAGFRRHASLAIVPIRDCPISHPLIGQFMAILNDRIEDGSLPNMRGRVRLDVRVVDGDESPALHVLIHPDEDRPPPETELVVLAETLSTVPFVTGILRLEQDESIVPVQGDVFGQVTVNGRRVTLSAAAFFQTNLLLLPRLIQRIEEEGGPLGGRRVADVYGGMGIFGLFLAADAAQVTIVDTNPIAIEAGERTARDWGLQNVSFIQGEADAAFDTPFPLDVAILDPPRTGLSNAVLDGLAATRPPVVLYVSCLAQSLARDLGPLTEAGYQVHGLELFDFYPQTYHVELLAILRRAGR